MKFIGMSWNGTCAAHCDGCGNLVAERLPDERETIAEQADRIEELERMLRARDDR